LHVSVIREEFCDGFEMKFTSPLGGVQQTGASETAAKSVTFVLHSVSDCKRLDTHLYLIIINFHREQTSGRLKVSHDMSYPAYTL